MSLKSIRADVASKLGFSVSNDTEKSYMNNLINQAAEEVWTKYDLASSLQELILYFDGNTKQVALPYYVFVGRAFRYYTSGYKIPVNGMHPRYQVMNLGPYLLNWREKYKSPLALQISNQSILKFTLTQRESSNVDIYIVGRTPNSYRVQEKVTIIAQALEASSVNDWTEIYSINKSAPNNYNITIEDVDGQILAELPNSELSSRYTIMQVLDDTIEGTTQTSGVEVLYKPIYHLMQNDYDEFQAIGYDQAIYWKALELWNGKQDDAAAIQRALACQTKCEQIITQVSANVLTGKELELQFSPNPLYGMFRPTSFLGTRFRM